MSDIIFHTLQNPHNHFIESLYTEIARYNATVAGDSKQIPLAICANNKNEQTLGAIYGWLQWGWLFIDLLWVDESLQNKGIGKTLLLQLEDAALQQGVDRAYLDTGSFQAPGFYEKNGYDVYAQMEVTADDGKHYIKYSMRKTSIRHWRKHHP